MSLRKTSFVLLVLAVTLAGCSTSGRSVAEVNGETITFSEVEALFQNKVVSAAQFRGAIGALIQQAVLTRSAEEQLDVVVDPSDIEREVQAVEDAFADSGQALDDALAQAGTTRDVIRLRAHLNFLQLGAVEVLAEQNLDLNTWVRREMEAADVRVNERYGVWRTEPDPLVYPPAD